jgi:type I restriction-modification system DNA methylase subunit
VADSITEWEFTGDVQKWITEILVKNSRLPFSEAKIEQRGSGSTKRRDLTLLDKDKKAVLTGEVKLPWAADGRSPYNEAVVQDARQKAKRARVRFFFTWNVNEFVLWETDSVEAPLKNRQFRSWPVTLVNKPEHLEVSSTIHTLKTWLPDFLAEFANIYLGAALLGTQMPDEKFLRMLEAALHQPIFYTQEELEARYQKPKLKAELDQWMKAKGWLIVDDPEGVRDNLERAAKYACYALVNKIVFHEALLKRFAGMMEKLSAPEKLITQGEDLRLRLEGYFQEAKIVTADYETVFGEDHTGIGNRIPFYSDHAVPYWRDLINQIHDFDFSRLDYEVIGNIFERLLSPGERKKYGQFYTRVEVVDLINSFCITSGTEKVMDPACGGGTFLVRAYARKREQAPRRKHGELLSDLFGVDIDEFATHLTTINLATRDLVDAENYPQIVRSDFFDLEANKTFMSLPVHAKGLGKIQHRAVDIPRLDAVIGNPPYVRQEQLRKAKNGKAPEKGTKEYYQDLVRREAGADLSGRSDIHCYFWPHAASFLKEDGYLCFLTSSQWLDVEYGFHLQDWILRNFEIVAVFESIDEPWFVGARVATTVTILRRHEDAARRLANTVRFVQLRRPIREILAHDGTTGGALKVADAFRDEILALPANTVNERYRARLVRQGDLWKDGVRLGVMMGRSQYPGSDDPGVQDGDYYGGKWGIYLRAPDLWFELLDNLGTRFTPLGDIAEVRFGVKTGNDSFFFPIDASDQCLAAHPDPTDFKTTYGIPRKGVASGQVKLVRCGEGRGEIRPLEEKYLEPEVHNLMEIKGFTVAPEDCGRQILLVGEKPDEIKDRHVLGYIKWGEKRGFNTGSTCRSRATADRGWYDLTGHKRGAFFWSMSQQYKHAIPANDHNLICNHNLFDISPKEGDAAILGGVLNSTWVVLSKFQYGRPVGVEGNLKTEVVDVKMMLVPDPNKGSGASLERVARAFESLKQRQALYFLSERRLRQMAYTQVGKEAQLDQLSPLSELDMDDRRELDDAVLEMLGVKSAERRQEMIDELYAYLREFFELTRQKEEKAIINKNLARRRGQASPTEVAAQILAEIQENHPDLLSRYDPDFLNLTKPFDTFDLPGEGIPQALKDTNPLLYDRGVVFLKGKKPFANLITKIPEQDPLIIILAHSGIHGLVRLPHDPEECQRLYHEYADFLRLRDETIRKLIADRTLDEEMQEKIYAALMPQLIWGK